MMLGSYPCCDGWLAIPMPAKTPQYMKENCPHCKAVVWHRMSKAAPASWTEEEFLKEYDVDEENKAILLKEATCPS